MKHDITAPAVAGFDLDLAEQLTQGEIQLKHPVTGAPLPIYVAIAGPEHEVRRNFVFALTRRYRAAYLADRTRGMNDPVDDADDEMALLVLSTLGWRGIVIAGEALAFSAGACTALYADPRRAWLRDQVKAALDKRELFIAPSSAA